MNVDEQRAADLLAAWQPWLDWQAAKQSVEINFLTLGELMAAPPTPAFVSREQEDAYRRGYWQGYHAALDEMLTANGPATRRGKPWKWLAEFCDGPLTRWRYGDLTQHAEPPAFRRARKATRAEPA